MYFRDIAHYDETLMYATYYAPLARRRLYMLGSELSQRYLYPTDLLIGIIGAEGAGKSTLTMGLFPGLQLTNDDDGVNTVANLIYSFDPENYFSGHTFHVDMRYELAFRPAREIVDAINNVVVHGRRVVVEHFDLVYAALGYNAQVIFGIGNEVIVARPSVFGPFPDSIKKIADKTLKFRLMAHSAEDITSTILEKDYNHTRKTLHSNIKHGFTINFDECPTIDIAELEAKVKEIIKRNLPVNIDGEDAIRIDDQRIYCTGVRTHVKSTGLIENFRLIPHYQYNPISRQYFIVGVVGTKEIAGFEEMTELRI